MLVWGNIAVMIQLMIKREKLHTLYRLIMYFFWSKLTCVLFPWGQLADKTKVCGWVKKVIYIYLVSVNTADWTIYKSSVMCDSLAHRQHVSATVQYWMNKEYKLLIYRRLACPLNNSNFAFAGTSLVWLMLLEILCKTDFKCVWMGKRVLKNANKQTNDTIAIRLSYVVLESFDHDWESSLWRGNDRQYSCIQHL